MLQSSNLFLNMTTEEDSTTYSGSLFHTLIILWVKKHFLTCNLHLLTSSFQLWPLRTCPPPSSSSNNSSNSTLSKPLTILKTWIKSPLILLFSNDVIPSACNRSSYDLFFKPFTSLVALCWTFSILSMSFLKYGHQTCTQYYQCGLTNPLNNNRKSSTSLSTKCLLITPNTCMALATACLTALNWRLQITGNSYSQILLLLYQEVSGHSKHRGQKS